MSGLVGNYVFHALRFVADVNEGAEFSEDEVKKFSSLLGMPTKKIDVALRRFNDVFRKYIVRRCVSYDDIEECIFTWNTKVPFRPFPLAMHSTGTVILFEDGKPKELVAFPQHKILNYGKRPGVPEEEVKEEVPIEVTKRVDGWHITAYYNPVIKEWVFATKYLLRNMYFCSGRLIIDSPTKVTNPYVEIATKIAEESGLLSKFKGYEGWTFNFVLKGPEPAVTKPPYPLPSDYSNFKLYLISARKSDGTLLTTKESVELIKWEAVPIVELKRINELYEEVKNSLTTRSYIVRLRSRDLINPPLIELESQRYSDAMMLKYLYRAKSLALLTLDEVNKEELVSLVEPQYREVTSKIIDEVLQIRGLIGSIQSVEDRDKVISEVLNELTSVNPKLGSIRFGEFKKALERQNIKRIVKKVVGLALEDSSIVGTAYDELVKIRETLDRVLSKYL
ncbi:MAG TPA: hypothetical protein ENF75_00645 [Acidilobales archaeon]|nr:hypothetical protein [Acidilobales archaeon]